MSLTSQISSDLRLRREAVYMDQFVVWWRAGDGLLMPPSNRMDSQCESLADRVLQQRRW
jgi:hypothetical protein